MRRLRKITLWVLGVTLAVVGLSWLALTAYVNSSYGRKAASTQLTQLIGLDVQVESLSVGTASTAVGLRIPDAAADTPADFLKIGSLETDVTLADLLTGNVAPTTVTVRDAEVLLRLDADDNLLTKLPRPSGEGGGGTLPAIQLANARIRIQQAGHPEFHLGPIDGHLRKDADDYVLTGEVADAKWGKWAVTGRLVTKTGVAHVELHAPDAPLEDALLRSIPYVPGEVWDNVAPTGRTAATVTFDRRPGTDLGYRVDLKPTAAGLRFPAADVTLTDVRGPIVVADGRVTIDAVTAKLADGAAKIDGAFDYASRPRAFAGTLDVTGADVRKMPASWGVPKEIEGKLRGTAKLELRIQPGGRLDPGGTGTGVIDGAKFAGFDAEIQLKLTGRDGKFHIDTVK